MISAAEAIHDIMRGRIQENLYWQEGVLDDLEEAEICRWKGTAQSRKWTKGPVAGAWRARWRVRRHGDGERGRSRSYRMLSAMIGQ